jgi:hypothetical protein
VGTVHAVPPGLSKEQLFQVQTWTSFAPLAASIAPIFSVTTYGPQHIEAEVRFRVPVEAEETAKRLDASLRDLLKDLHEAGYDAVLDLTALFGAKGVEITVWKLALLVDPTNEDPAKLRPGLETIAEAVRTTKIGDHLMSPEEEWLPKRKTNLGDRRS